MQRGVCSALLIACALVSCGEAGSQLNPKHRPPQPGLKTLIVINGETFYLGMDQYVDWYDAKSNCEALGMQLVTLDTEERWYMISDWMLAHPTYDSWFWTSGQKPISQSQFIWTTTGNNFEFTNWNSGEPNQGSSVESCMNFYADRGGWDDDPCLAITLQYMCENVPA